jgi:ABC-type antimicrobial peptide transport system permease subunit
VDLKSILLSQSLAKKIFGDQDPLNQTVIMDAKWDLKVTGVYEDLPKNSTFHEGSWFAPLDLYLAGWSDLNVWDNQNMNVYVQLHPDANAAKVSAAIKDAMLPHVDEHIYTIPPHLFLLPMSQWHLSSEFKNGVSVTSERMKVVWVFGLIGVFVLLLACINFMNLSTARSEKRAREVGIRKAIGSYRSQLIGQFFSESLVVVTLSFLLSVGLTGMLLPGFNSIADKSISMPWFNAWFWLAGLLFIFVAGLLSGSYPALYLSSFSPVRVLKGPFKAGRFASLPRKVLVVVQFTVSIILIIGTIIVYAQISFVRNRPVGYSRDGLIFLHSRSPEVHQKYEGLRNELKMTGVVTEVAGSDHSINSTLGWNGGFDWRGRNRDLPNPAFNINEVTYGYGETIGWEFIAGRDFSRRFPADADGVVMNESALKLMGLENPVNEKLTLDRGDVHREYTILGVVRDVVKGSPFEATDPCLYFLNNSEVEWIYIRMDPAVSARQALPKIERAFKSVISSAPFDYKFADEEYSTKFRSEERIGTLAAIFSALAILISCSGLFGLASFVAEQRTKELGIRKIMGASVANLWRMLSSDFVGLVFVSCALAAPIAWHFLGDWLQQYEYRTTLTWWPFAVSGAAALIITLFTVSFQTLRAARMNPVRSLRSE